MSIAEEFRRLTDQLRNEKPAYVLAELNDLLTGAPREQIELLSAPSIHDPYLANYVAAMVEQAIHLKGGIRPPLWTARVAPLSSPVFAAPWMSLRAHLLLESPVPFRRRNIFIDSSVGGRV
jgi:hypothetical protein